MKRNPLLTSTAAALADNRAGAIDVGLDPADHHNDGFALDHDGEQLDREERAALQRVSGLSTELEDVTEVEYRQLRLERVVLAAVWCEGTLLDAENSLRELAALAETAGSQVLD